MYVCRYDTHGRLLCREKRERREEGMSVYSSAGLLLFLRGLRCGRTGFGQLLDVIPDFCSCRGVLVSGWPLPLVRYGLAPCGTLGYFVSLRICSTPAFGMFLRGIGLVRLYAQIWGSRPVEERMHFVCLMPDSLSSSSDLTLPILYFGIC
jgi:hypothetical protein